MPEIRIFLKTIPHYVALASLETTVGIRPTFKKINFTVMDWIDVFWNCKLNTICA